MVVAGPGVQIGVLPFKMVYCVLVMLAEFINATHQTMTARKIMIRILSYLTGCNLYNCKVHVQHVPVHCSEWAIKSHHFGSW